MSDDNRFTFPFHRDHPTTCPADFARLREQRVAQLTMPSGSPGYLVGRYDDVRRVLLDPRCSADLHRPGVPQMMNWPPLESLNFTDPPRHTRLRRLVAKAFTPELVESFRPRIHALTHELLDEMERNGSPADIVESYAHPLPINMICDLLGVPRGDRAQFRKWSEAFLVLDDNPVEEIQASAKELREYLDGLVADKRREPGDDVLSALVEARDVGDKLSEGELASTATQLLMAGHETTFLQIGLSVATLLLHPDQLADLREHPELMPHAIEELMRYQGPGDGAAYRILTEDMTFGDVTVPAGSGVLAAISAANRDEERFPDAGRFDLRREDPRHLTLGHGVHHCLGAPLVRMELEIALTNLFDRFPKLELAIAENELDWMPGRLLSGFREVPVIW
ncbi:Cytochrome P450 [Lentzea albidocapillata subsp. violacea]|uniref:Cytochrome P450 n=1 Tax=Lentzea albidocapillata subsp. violacea TaxID=128104 RepID=A0A1G9LQS2_9PSEU|nr:cytochrome P450 [Lentzea albidocapillata]SDL64392.1 Cytochrome P450 [Lentzea albidocapillata subsp. violacea]